MQGIFLTAGAATVNYDSISSLYADFVKDIAPDADPKAVASVQYALEQLLDRCAELDDDAYPIVRTAFLVSQIIFSGLDIDNPDDRRAIEQGTHIATGWHSDQQSKDDVAAFRNLLTRLIADKSDGLWNLDKIN